MDIPESLVTKLSDDPHPGKTIILSEQEAAWVRDGGLLAPDPTPQFQYRLGSHRYYILEKNMWGKERKRLSYVHFFIQGWDSDSSSWVDIEGIQKDVIDDKLAGS